MKQCSKCGINKSVDEFYRDSRKGDGLFSACKQCHNKLSAAWVAKNSERKKKTNRLWREANRQLRYDAFRRRYERADSILPIRKRCCACGQEKSADEFHRKKDSRDGLYPRCKICRAKADQQRRIQNAAHLTEYERRRYLSDPNRRLMPKKWYEDNKAKALVRMQAYAQQKPDIVRATKKRYVALHGHYSRHLMQAVVKWANIDAIYRFYEERDSLASKTGIEHHVHHIVPISSGWVCGLHNEFNLQVTTAKYNLSINNRSWPDMPDFLDETVRYTANVARHLLNEVLHEAILPGRAF